MVVYPIFSSIAIAQFILCLCCQGEENRDDEENKIRIMIGMMTGIVMRMMIIGTMIGIMIDDWHRPRRG